MTTTTSFQKKSFFRTGCAILVPCFFAIAAIAPSSVLAVSYVDDEVVDTDTSYSTTGDEDIALFAYGYGYYKGTNITLSTSGATAHGLYIDGDTGNYYPYVVLKNSKISTQGANSVGVVVRGGGFAEFSDVTINTSGVGATGIYTTNAANDSFVSLNGTTTIITQGEGASCIFATAGGVVNASGNVKISVHQPDYSGTYAIAAKNGGTINFEDAVITNATGTGHASITAGDSTGIGTITFSGKSSAVDSHFNIENGSTLDISATDGGLAIKSLTAQAGTIILGSQSLTINGGDLWVNPELEVKATIGSDGCGNITFANGAKTKDEGPLVLKLTLDLADGYTLTDNDTFCVFKGLSESIATSGVTINGQNIAEGGTLTIGDKTFAVTSLSGDMSLVAIPEPGTYALVGAVGMITLLALRRRRKVA